MKYYVAASESEAQRPSAPICEPAAHELTEHREGGARASWPFGSTARHIVGGIGAEDTPVPIPNTAVKLCSADGTAGAAWWESTSPPTPYEGPRSLQAIGGLPRSGRPGKQRDPGVRAQRAGEPPPTPPPSQRSDARPAPAKRRAVSTRWPYPHHALGAFKSDAGEGGRGPMTEE